MAEYTKPAEIPTKYSRLDAYRDITISEHFSHSPKGSDFKSKMPRNHLRIEGLTLCNIYIFVMIGLFDVD